VSDREEAPDDLPPLPDPWTEEEVTGWGCGHYAALAGLLIIASGLALAAWHFR
jgi:hypothetical protein